MTPDYITPAILEALHDNAGSWVERLEVERDEDFPLLNVTATVKKWVPIPLLFLRPLLKWRIEYVLRVYRVFVCWEFEVRRG